MKSQIARVVDSATERIFQAIAPSLYHPKENETLQNPEQAAAASLLAAPQKRLTVGQKYFGWKQDGATRLLRALFLHRQAFESERAGEWRRADFFWQRLYDVFSRTFEDGDEWKSLAGILSDETPGLSILSDPAQLRARVVNELLVDTHVAFYNGHAEATGHLGLQSRAWIHLGHIATMSDWNGFLRQDKLNLICPPIEELIELSADAHDWRKAIDSCSLLLRYDPESLKYQDKVVNLCFQYTLESCGPADHRAEIIRGNTFLQSSVEHLEGIRNKYPHNLLVHQRLADLHQLLAIRLATVGQLSAALVAARKATAFNPSSEGACRTMLELAARMEELKDQAQQIRPRLAGEPSLRIHPETIMMLDESRLGFTPLEEFERSGEPQQTAEAFRIAKARTLWRRIGLNEPADRWNERAQKLSTAIDRLIAHPPPSKTELRAAWQQLAAAHQDLEQNDHGAVCAFLESELWAQPGEMNATESADYVPLLVPAPARPKQLREPFSYWLLSPKDLRPKLQALVAIVVLTVIGVVGVKDARARGIRGTTYQQIIQASNSRDYLQVIEGAELFLSHPTVIGSDPRDQEVLRRYNEALVRWVARRPDVLQPAVAVHLERYRELTGKRN